MMNKKNIFLCLAAMLIAVLVLHLVYQTIDQRVREEIETKEEYVGDIETTGKKWLNGHLGLFFRFKYLGNINWLIIPLLIWFFVSKARKKLERWQMALVFVWLFTVLLIAVKGYANPRYQLTLFPITSVMVLFLLWKFLEDKKKYTRIFCFSFVAVMCIFNILHYFDNYKATWNLRVALSNPYFPQDLVNYLNTSKDINDESRVFVINQPIFYYHTQKKGVDYLSPYAVFAWIEFRKKVGSRRKAFRLLKKAYKVNYILLKAIHKRFYRSIMLEEFLNCECKLVREDNGWLLYKLRDKLLEEELQAPAHKQIKVWYGDQLKPPGTIKDVKEISPSLFRLSRRGIYKFEVKDKKQKTILVHQTRIKKGEKNRIQFGYEFNRRGLDEKIPEGKYVNFVVRTAISPNLLNIHNCIIAVDYRESDKTWEQEKTVFTSHQWRTYIVSKKVRPGTTRLILMFRFTPQSQKDRLRIKDTKIVISEKPL
ncbi:MAG: hypothetical protein GTO45_28350 [Candidatus Aminicenantes bacterium]|nr:hypothetical protein [Candidatus Aminicenantes bacterium]NIM82713.1 hypothetical protein [Candidatus Aminicenantes bacterium]NIN22085.1 hypothetical protein [Candidatus Aminicenantes bacterium]NIN45844.1 hypothetical protein [Candidatus Aminicenantes bacterium]NIN88681.1 hypothetical protein [Candidatus Aminicenantes bacterium]